ncbi:HNH/ENDO VII family nuclease [Kroppenstedtia pulmonis]|uniref:HNH/ENDO VII family nuclease n=1 Tax=Kroppenstedtia pulmonis TaxID=1380685 RepID=UPI003CCE3461
MQLHHVTGKEPGAMAEMLGTEHRRYSGPIHRLIEYSFRNNRTLNNQYEAFRKQYWKWRARSLE